jgi:hypothetical protein
MDYNKPNPFIICFLKHYCRQRFASPVTEALEAKKDMIASKYESEKLHVLSTAA